MEINSLEKLPISFRLVNEMHQILMEGVRGQDKRPGKFRDNQVFIGSPHSRLEDARFCATATGTSARPLP